MVRERAGERMITLLRWSQRDDYELRKSGCVVGGWNRRNHGWKWGSMIRKGWEIGVEKGVNDSNDLGVEEARKTEE